MNKKLERGAIRLIEKIMRATEVNNSGQARGLLTQLEKQYKDTVNYKINGPGCYINTGDITNDMNLVRQGINLGVPTLNALPNEDVYRGLLQFNIGNGFYAEYKIDRRFQNRIDYYQYEPLQKAKWFYRRAIESQNISDNLRKQASVNLANVYDTLGRTVEAIHLYEKVLQSDQSFVMAKANLGKALYFFSSICREYQGATMLQAYQLISDALQDAEQVAKIGGSQAISVFERELEKIGSHFPDKSILSTRLAHPSLNTSRMTQFEQAYLNFCSRNKLFLNFHIHMIDVTCKASVSDNINITLVENPKAKSRFTYYSKYINQIKEDFATARYLLFHSVYPRPYLNRISRLTHYVDTLDYVDNNLYLGMLKTAFNRAYSILDKIGVFLDAYLALKTKRRIYFTTIWADKHKSQWLPKDKITSCKNVCLLGLYDVNCDFRTGEYDEITRIRNASTHDRLSVVDSFFEGLRSQESHELVVSVDKLRKKTILLMLIVKTCISNLVNFVNIEEKRKLPKGALTFPMLYFSQKQDLY